MKILAPEYTPVASQAQHMCNQITISTLQIPWRSIWFISTAHTFKFSCYDNDFEHWFTLTKSTSHQTEEKRYSPQNTALFRNIQNSSCCLSICWRKMYKTECVLMIQNMNLETRNTLMHVHSSSCGICFITNSYKSSRLRDPVYSATFSPSLYRNSVGNPSTCKGHILHMVTNHIQWGCNKHITYET